MTVIKCEIVMMNNDLIRLTGNTQENSGSKQPWQSPGLETSKIKDLTKTNAGFGADGGPSNDAFNTAS